MVDGRGGTRGGLTRGAYGTDPIALVSWHEQWGEVAGMAHELAHAVHRHLSSLNNRPALAEPPKVLTEILPMVHELLLGFHLSERRDPALRAMGLAQLHTTLQMNGLFAAAGRSFRLAVHQELEQNRPVTGTLISKRYGAEMRRLHGDVVDCGPRGIALMWVRHVQNFKGLTASEYLVGVIAATDLVSRVRAGGTRAAEAAHAIAELAGGGGASPGDQLAALGVVRDGRLDTSAYVATMAEVADEWERATSVVR